MRRLVVKRKIIIAVLVTGVLLAGITYYIKHRHSAASPQQEAIVVETAKVTQGSIAIEAQTAGTLIANKSVQLTPEFAGLVSKVLFHDGEFVKQGTPLIQLDDAVLKVKAESAKANLHYSETNYHRMELLSKKGAISQQAVDQALADLKEKKAIAEESRVMAEKMLLIAPFDGKLGKSNVNPGEYVTVGQKVVSLTDTRHLRVEYTIAEKYIGLVKLGQSVKIMSNVLPNKSFMGKVSYIAPTINTEDRTISVYAEVPNDDGALTAGLFVNVTQYLGNADNILMVPAVSLVATIDGQQVYKIVDNKVVSVSVKLGQRTTHQVQILEGLNRDDVVVTAGQQKVKDGALVKVRV